MQSDKLLINDYRSDVCIYLKAYILKFEFNF